MKRDLYNHISRNRKFYILTPILFILIIFVGVIFFYKSIFCDINFSYYFFSTVVQGFLALIGVLGATGIFKLQLMEQEAGNVTEGLRNYTRHHNGFIVDTYSWIEMMNACEYILQSNKDFGHNESIRIGLDKLKKIRDEKSGIRNKIVDFSLVCFVNVTVALLGFFYSKIMVSQGFYAFDAIYLVFNFGLSLAAIYGAFGVVRIVFGYSFSL